MASSNHPLPPLCNWIRALARNAGMPSRSTAIGCGASSLVAPARAAATLAMALVLGACGGKRSEPPVGTNGPDLVLSGLSHTPVTVQAGQTVVVADIVLNQGNQPAGPFRVGIYASSDSTITPADTLLGHRTIGGLGSRETTRGSGSLTVNLTAGSWYIAAIVDDQDTVQETVEANNALASGQLTVTP